MSRYSDTLPGGLITTYRGEHITRASRNAMGLKYESYAGGRFLRADTLAGIRELIRDAHGISR